MTPLAPNGVTSTVFGDVKEAELEAVVYRCQQLADCNEPDHPHPCANCRAFNYGRIAFTSVDKQQTLKWRIQNWVRHQTERVLRRFGGQAAVDEFRHQLASQTKEK